MNTASKLNQCYSVVCAAMGAISQEWAAWSPNLCTAVNRLCDCTLSGSFPSLAGAEVLESESIGTKTISIFENMRWDDIKLNTFNWAGRCDKVEKLRHFGARQTSHAMRLWDGTCLNTISCYIFEWPSTNPRLFCVLTYHRASTRRVDVIFGKGSAFVFWFHRRQPAMLFGLKLS